MNVPLQTMSLGSVLSVARRPIWRENLFWLELAALMRDPQFRWPRPPSVNRSVLVIPGFMTGDRHLGLMKRWLTQSGHRPESAGIRMNVDCSESAVARLEDRLEEFSGRTGERVVLIGQSRGGLFARVLAVRRPDLVDCIVTLGSPHRHPTHVHPLVLLQGASLATAGSLGMHGLFRHSCRTGQCCSRFREDLATPFPSDVRFYSIYSKSDGIVDWKACFDDAAVAVEINSTHCGMGVNTMTYRFLADLFSGPPSRAIVTEQQDEVSAEFHRAA